MDASSAVNKALNLAHEKVETDRKVKEIQSNLRALSDQLLVRGKARMPYLNNQEGLASYKYALLENFYKECKADPKNEEVLLSSGLMATVIQLGFDLHRDQAWPVDAYDVDSWWVQCHYKAYGYCPPYHSPLSLGDRRAIA